MGKTTLLHVLAGLLTFAEGEVHLGQYSLEKMTDTEKSECCHCSIPDSALL